LETRGWGGLGPHRSGCTAKGDDSVRLEVTLPGLLHKFGEAVQKTTAGKVKSCLRRNWKAAFGVLKKKT